MEVDRPGPGEELQESGVVTTPRQAATVILLRGGSTHLEVLLAQRNPAARFMGGAWVFPGGAVDATDGSDDDAHRLAGVRECTEEVGVTLPDPDALIKFSRWITPREVKIRFDTHFFLAEMPPDAEVQVDGSETVDARWFTPSGALAAYRDDEILLVFPTIKHLEQLEPFGSADELMSWASGREVEPVTPQVLMSGETARVVLPGEPGYVED